MKRRRTEKTVRRSFIYMEKASKIAVKDGGSKDVSTLKSKGIVSVFRARINRFDEDFGFLSEGIFLAY